MPITIAGACPRCGQPLPAHGRGGLCAFCIGQNLFASAPKQEEALQAALTMDGYALGPEIGFGAMGRIFRARHVALGREVALKLIHGGAWAGEQELARFRSEAAFVARLDHPNIVPIFEVGEAEGMLFFSMKLVEGGSLATRMSEFSRPREAAGKRRIAELMAKIARAVQHAHERGVLHRDLKPGNILLDEAGEPLVADFGLARQLDSTPGSLTLGAALGTPAYMAPEQARGGATTTAADVHALGAVLYELLTGQPPYHAESSSATLALVLDGEPPAHVRTLAPATERDLATICEHSIEREPADRYTSARALADDLDRWLRGEPIRARRVHWLERMVKWARRRPALAAVSGAALALAIAGLAFWLNAEAARQRENAVQKIADELHRTQQELGVLLRSGGGIGQRFRALEVFGKLARSGGATADLRSEAIVSLCLPDFQQLSATTPKISTTNIGIDPARGRFAFGWTHTELGGQIHVEDAGGKKIIRPPDVHIAGWLQFSPDGRWLAARSGSEASWWRLDDGKLAARAPCPLGIVPPRGLSFSGDSSRVAHIGDAGRVFVRAVATGAELASFQAGAEPTSLRWEPHGNRIALLTHAGIEMWRAAPDAAPARLAQASYPGTFGVSWSGDGAQIIVLASDRSLFVRDAVSLKSRLLEAPWDSVLIHYAEFHPAGRYVMTSSDMCETRLWDVVLDRQVLRADGLRMIEISPDGRRFGFHLRPHFGPAVIMDFTPADEFRGVRLGAEAKARFDVVENVLRVQGEKGPRWFDLASHRDVPPGDTAQGGHIASLRAVAPGLEVSSSDTHLELRTLPGREFIARIAPPEPEPLAGVCFSSDHRWLIGLAKSGTVFLWDLPLIRQGLTAVGLDW